MPPVITPTDSRRRRLAWLAMVLAALAVVLPLAFSAWIGWQSAQGLQTQRLQLMAAKAEERAQISLGQARVALKALNLIDAAPCAPRHLDLMRQLTLDTLSVEEIAYVESDRIVCTSWGERDLALPMARSTPLDGGLRAFPAMHSHVPDSGAMLGLQQGRYLVLINLSRFVDVSVDPDIHLAFGRAGGEVLARSTSRDTASSDAGPEPADQADLPVAAMSFDGWQVTARGPEVSRAELLRQELRTLPAGALCAALAIFLIVRLWRRRLSPLTELQLGIQHKEFVVHYQPIIELATGRCCGAEALVRWRRPDGSMVRPDLFIPLAEDNGLISQITVQVVEQVVADMRELLERHPDLHIAVNLSEQDIRDPALIASLDRRLQVAGVRTEQVWLEVTERGCVDGADSTASLRAAREAGHHVAIDDFGTGYCGLKYLQTLPLDVLKIDQSFVRSIETDGVCGPVVDSIIALAGKLSLKIVAEGVETREQAAFLRHRGVQYAQGWLFAKAMPAADFIARFAAYGTGTQPDGDHRSSTSDKGLADLPITSRT